MSTIYLIRHGEIPQSRPRRFVGGQDLPLTDNGRAQIARLAQTLGDRAIKKILCSTLCRSVESARILALHLGLETAQELSEFREIGLGAWEGLTVDEVRASFPGCYEARGRNIAAFRPEGGESFADLQARAWPAFLAATANEDERLAIVAHAGVNRVLLCRILGMPLENLFLLEQHYGCLNVVHREQAGFRVESINIIEFRSQKTEDR